MSFAFSAWNNLFEIFYDHEDWDLDEIFSLFVILGIAGLIFSDRRLHDLSREMKARRVAENEAGAAAAMTR